ncbi:polysaccharide deacetylase family protein [Zhaonella formicivorans]|jgi:polysaccharide deacetylase family sporulation protein PdaB|uniref:polysaccharide deacetylase family protein n=1 Tax=Zhaonella formicivorans TaxID=2528593 RepID=UPI0010E4E3DA|nr:polysaccharide deacetylase family protein [Zhaonella formicivorans]
MRVLAVPRWFKSGLLFLLFLAVGIFLTKGPLAGPSQALVSFVTGVKKLHPIYCVGIDEPKVAISFDATWGAAYTKQLLDTLDKYNVKTTFFLVNIWLDKYPEEAKEIVKRGHELGLHSSTHPDFKKLSEEAMVKELQDNYNKIYEITGFKPILFRPPYGSYNNTLITVTQRLGLHAIQWDVDSLDWRDLSAQQIYQRVTSRVKNGSIVLFHNNATHTPEALGPILENLHSRGFKIVPISELIYKEDYYVDVNGVQRKN